MAGIEILSSSLAGTSGYESRELLPERGLDHGTQAFVRELQVQDRLRESVLPGRPQRLGHQAVVGCQVDLDESAERLEILSLLDETRENVAASFSADVLGQVRNESVDETMRDPGLVRANFL